jgi:hypothetical protein
MKGQIIFTKELHKFLIQEGFTHVYNMGVRDNAFIADGEENETYIVVPLKPDDGRLLFQEADMHIEVISHHETIDMAAGDEFITFVAELPLVVIEKYLKSNV